MKTNHNLLRAALLPAVLVSVAFFTTACLENPAPAAAPYTDAAESTQGPVTTAAASPVNTVASSQSEAVPQTPEITPAETAMPADPLEKAVGDAVLSRLWDDQFGEAKTEGHVILSTAQDKNGNTAVYAVASYCTYGFENGLFTVTSGSGAIPAVITFEKNGGGYVFLSYKEPEDGSRNAASLKELFPKEILSKAQNAGQYASELQEQKEAQAQAYLESIGRDAEIHTDYVEKELFHITAQASNALLEIAQCRDYPYWIGSRETVENDIRCIYEAGEEDFDGYTVLTFTKKTADGNIVELLKYKATDGGVEPMQ